ncbi:CPBP family intramembrane metalloprotease [Lactiplantibacillus plantarum]|uniref:CPBP family intramembrane glutamic endopeptidase n=2 Tax=Lactobacillaceae TaxID=33958 RepID=UPI001EE37F07|nr:CPBP family intramembrane glutamic endopeptidase [Lactiplantibacillus plantarum]
MIVAMLTMVVLIIVDLKLSAMLNIPETSNSRSLAWMLGEAPLPMIVSVVIFSPICEELIFRGIFFSYALTNQYNHRNYQMIAVVINSLIFASVHVDANWEPWIYYTLMGSILGTTYLLAKRDIRLNILVHMGTNLAVFALAAMS